MCRGQRIQLRRRRHDFRLVEADHVQQKDTEQCDAAQDIERLDTMTDVNGGAGDAGCNSAFADAAD
jgi:hypothetical protein